MADEQSLACVRKHVEDKKKPGTPCTDHRTTQHNGENWQNVHMKIFGQRRKRPAIVLGSLLPQGVETFQPHFPPDPGRPKADR